MKFLIKYAIFVLGGTLAACLAHYPDQPPVVYWLSCPVIGLAFGLALAEGWIWGWNLGRE